MGNPASEPKTYVLGPDPIDGAVVLLPIADADYVWELHQIISTAKSVREFHETMTGLSGSSPYDDLDDEEDLEDGWLDAPFDVSSVPGYGDGYFPPQVGTIMLDGVDNTVLDIIDGLWVLQDNMGGVPRIWIDPSAEEPIAARMRVAGFVIVDWSTFGQAA